MTINQKQKKTRKKSKSKNKYYIYIYRRHLFFFKLCLKWSAQCATSVASPAITSQILKNLINRNVLLQTCKLVKKAIALRRDSGFNTHKN